MDHQREALHGGGEDGCSRWQLIGWIWFFKRGLGNGDFVCSKA